MAHSGLRGKDRIRGPDEGNAVFKPTCEIGGKRAARHRQAEAPLRVAHVVLSLDVGGLERVVVDLVREGRRRGQEPAVVCLERPGTLAPQVEAAGACVECVDKHPGLRLDTVYRLRGVLSRLKAEVIHTHQIGALCYASLASRGGLAPVLVHTEHGRRCSEQFRTRLLGQLISPFADRVFCVSKDIADQMLALNIAPRHKVSVVVNGIDLGRFRLNEERETLARSLNIPPGAPVIGTVGRLAEVKRQDRLLRAFGRVVQAVPEAHLLLVGDGPLRDELQTVATDLGIGDRVHFAGYTAQPERYLALMDTFALTSRSEGTPLAVLEAWAAGLPVIASRVGGLPDLLGGGSAGILFPPEDEDALAQGLQALLLAPDRARQMGFAGRRIVEASFTSEHMADEYERWYTSLLKRRGRRTVSAPTEGDRCAF